MKVIFDLDGTLANAEHRVHLLTGEVRDWRAFYSACDMDQPILPILSTALALIDAGSEVEIWTGRSAEVAAETFLWLDRHGLGEVPIRMRPVGDHQPDTELKDGWLQESAVKPDLVFEDRASVVAMWRARGIICAQIAPGQF